jgi:hypothetical protein
MNESIILHLDKDDAHVVLYALSRRMREVEADLSILLISRARDLTLTEKAMLPPQLLEAGDDDDERLGHKLREQIDPWISLRDHLAFLIKQIEEQITQKEKINLRCDFRCDLCSRGHNGFRCDDSIEKPTPPPNVTIREGSTKEIPVKE